MPPLLPEPGRDWPNAPINQFGSLAWEGLKRPAGPIIRSIAEATAEPLTRTKGEVPLFVFGQGLSFKVASGGRLIFGLPAGFRNAFLGGDPQIRHRLIWFNVTCIPDVKSQPVPVDNHVGRQHLKDRAPFFSPPSPLVVIPQTVHRWRLGMLGWSPNRVCLSLLFAHTDDNVAAPWPLCVWETKTTKTIGLPHAPDPLLTMVPVYYVSLFTFDILCHFGPAGIGATMLSL